LLSYKSKLKTDCVFKYYLESIEPKGLNAMPALSKFLVLLALFLLASHVHACTSLSSVAGDQVRVNHLIRLQQLMSKPTNETKAESKSREPETETKAESKSREPENDPKAESKSREPENGPKAESKSREPGNESKAESYIASSFQIFLKLQLSVGC